MADSKVSGLTQQTILDAADQFYLVDPLSKRVTVADMQKNFGLTLLTPPIDSQFSWVNQGGASIIAGNQGISLSAPAAGAGTRSLRIRDKAPAFSTPYTVTAGFRILTFNLVANDGIECGLLFRNAGAGTLAAINYATFQANIPNIQSRKYTSPTVFSADYLGSTAFWPNGDMLWFRIQDNGVNRICSVSGDGVNFVQFHSIARTDFLTADRVGFYLSNAVATPTGILTLVSWKEENV